MDIGCGSNHLNSPWFCRALHLLGAKAVGVDFNDLEGENFEHHKLDITVPGALNLFPDHSFDGINMRGLAYLHCIKDEELRGVIEKEIPRQINRLLRPDGKIIVVQLDRYPDTCPINC